MKFPRVRWGATTLVAASALSACGSGDEKQAVPIADLVTSLTTSECQLFVRCRLASDQPYCENYMNAQYSNGGHALAAIVAGAKTGRAKYDGQAARQLLDTIAGLSCADIGTSGGTIMAGWSKIFTGTIADGASCASDMECWPQSFCASLHNGPDATCTGVCAHGGVDCNDDTDCLDGKVCDLVGIGVGQGSCATPIAAGELGQPCGTNGSCKAGLTCINYTDAHICEAYPHEGGNCDLLPCPEGLICVRGGSDHMTCVAPGMKGEACSSTFQCGGSFVTSLVCDTTLHHCVDSPTTGPCVGNSTLACNSMTSYCDAETVTCLPIKPIGSPCTVGKSECGSRGTSCIPAAAGAGTGTCTISSTCDD